MFLQTVPMGDALADLLGGLAKRVLAASGLETSGTALIGWVSVEESNAVR
jgi:hypothetical protein